MNINLNSMSVATTSSATTVAVTSQTQSIQASSVAQLATSAIQTLAPSMPNNKAKFELAFACENGTPEIKADIKRAIPLYCQLAATGNENAIYRLRQIYEKVKTDKEATIYCKEDELVTFYTLAADHDQIKAIFWLGDHYEKSNNKDDKAKAIALYEKASKLGNLFGHTKLLSMKEGKMEQTEDGSEKKTQEDNSNRAIFSEYVESNNT